MKFAISRDTLLKPLSLVAGVVERRQTLAILSNVLITLDGDRLTLTGTDTEVEFAARITLPDPGESGEITVPARKLADICKSLPEAGRLEFTLDGERLQLRCGRSRFTLSTLPASEFPNTEQADGSVEFTMSQVRLRQLIDRTAFSMAQQDVRYYLNGMLFELTPSRLRTVATDGHRLAMATFCGEMGGVRADAQVILPRKGCSSCCACCRIRPRTCASCSAATTSTRSRRNSPSRRSWSMASFPIMSVCCHARPTNG